MECSGRRQARRGGGLSSILDYSVAPFDDYQSASGWPHWPGCCGRLDVNHAAPNLVGRDASISDVDVMTMEYNESARPFGPGRSFNT